MSDPRGFDPRYSPEFQRGYEPIRREIPAEQRERLELRRERTTRPRIEPMPVVPVSEPPVAGSPATLDGSSDEGIDVLFSDEHDDAEVEAPLWRNPYLITLAILGFVLIVGGIALFRWSVDQVYGGQYIGSPGSDGRQEWLWVQIAWGLAPLLAIAGTFTVLGIFFFLASKWRPRRVDDDAADDDELEK